MQCFPGATVGRITSLIQQGKASIHYPHTILHVGTNNVANKTVAEFIAEYTNLLTVIRSQSDTKPLVSAILPRPVDFEAQGNQVLKMNQELSTLCFCRKVRFLKSYRPFLSGGVPKRELLATQDGGLHLNFEGSRRLRKMFIDVINGLQ